MQPLADLEPNFDKGCRPRMKRPILLMILFTAFAILTAPVHLQAQAFNRGLKAFQQGDFRNAKKYLGQGIRKSRDPYQQALMYKLIGVADYNLGRKRGAVVNFKKAIKLDPAAKLSRSETKDRRIISMFNSLKKGKMSRSKKGRGKSSFRAARRGSSRSGANSTSLIENLLPFGYPQYVQGKIITGAILTTGQVAGLFLYFERSNAAKTADEDAFQVIQEQDSNNSYDQTEFDAYIDANAKFVLAARAESLYGIVLFGGLWTAGIVEAILNPPEAPRSRRRRAQIEKAESGLAANESLESYYFNDSPAKPQGFNLALSPDGSNGQLQWTLAF